VPADRFGVGSLEIRFGSENAYYGPSVAITSSMMNTHQLVSNLCLKADIPPEELISAAARLRRTHWLHFAKVKGTDPVLMEGLRPLRLRTSRRLLSGLTGRQQP
jgi:hypothetical protein